MFGRRKRSDDDPFAALKGGGSTYQSDPTVAVPGIPGSSEVSAAPLQAPPVTIGGARPAPVSIGGPGASPPPPRATPRTVPRVNAPRVTAARARRSRRKFPFWVILPVIAVLSVIGAVNKSTSNSNSSAGAGAGPSSVTVTGGTATSSSSSSSVTSSGSGTSSKPKGPTSYLTTANLSAGLARVEKMAPGSKLLDLRLDAMSLDATVVGHGGVKSIDFGPYGTFVSTGASTGSRAISYSSIHPSVVPRLIAELHRAFHVPPSHVNYVVAFWFPGLAPFWGIYLKAPSTADYEASLTGAGLHLNP
jgi:hypothetical protein